MAKSYKTAVSDFPALKGVDFEMKVGEIISAIDKSGWSIFLAMD